jgi:hypothetical protein
VKNTSAAVARTESETTDPISMGAPLCERRAKLVLKRAPGAIRLFHTVRIDSFLTTDPPM